MPTIRLVPSAYSRSSTNRVTVTSPGNMYYNTDHTANYCSIRGRNSSSSTYYAFINGFDFSEVPANATVSSFSIKIRCYRNSYLQQGTSYRPRLASSASNNGVISGTTLDTDVTTSAGGTVYTFPIPSTLTWNTLKGYGTGFSIEIPLRSSSSQYPYLYVYGAEIEVTYSAETVHVASVSLDKDSDSIEIGETTTLTETVLPANATDKSVTWSSNNTAVATVSGGVVTGVGQGIARISVTTTDGGYTDYCDVTVTPAVTYDYYPASSMQVGKEYLIADGNSGTVRLLTDVSGGSRTLQGVQATVSNGRLSITGSVKNDALFECVRYTAGNDNTITVSKDGKYLYCDNSSGLRMDAPATLNRFWHYRDGKFWQFKSTSADGYDDTSSEYKYYLEVNGGNFTDNHVTSPSIEDSDIPLIYLFTDTAPAPVITVGTPTRTIISDESGYDQCVCTFSSDLALQAWEARATKSGVAPARGVGLLVESGGSLAAGATGTVYVDNEELTQGDGDYTITVYGQSTGGIWSQ